MWESPKKSYKKKRRFSAFSFSIIEMFHPLHFCWNKKKIEKDQRIFHSSGSFFHFRNTSFRESFNAFKNWAVPVWSNSISYFFNKNSLILRNFWKKGFRPWWKNQNDRILNFFAGETFFFFSSQDFFFINKIFLSILTVWALILVQVLASLNSKIQRSWINFI